VLFALAGLLVGSFILSWLLTAAMVRVAPAIGFVDRPGHRKIHSNPKPLGGGVAIFLAIALPMIAGIGFVQSTRTDRTPITGDPVLYEHSTPWFAWYSKVDPAAEEEHVAYLRGAGQQTPLALGLLAAALLLHITGLIDDKRHLGPWSKLSVQLAVAAAFVVYFDVRAVTFLDNLGVGRWPSVAVTVIWIAAITNAFNFLDNMDGLSAGVAAVCATAFLSTAIMIEQWFVAATLALLLGAVLGFLCWNFPPARIFMGDSGSLVIGFILGVLTVRTTFLPPGSSFGAGWYAIFAPVIVLAVPLYDLVVVSIIRLSRGHSPFRGDTNHFSHRLVARGMSRRTAVLCIYVVTAATSTSAIVLPWARSNFVAVLIFSQTILVLGLVALLEQHPLPAALRGGGGENNSGGGGGTAK
jgi:UDP-GlcNAc:undecaprenyl-phosphate GlcNAc-1-phosphate transferase